MREKSTFTKQWIIDNSIPIINKYEKGILTIRGLHYQLVSIGMTNDMSHYKKVVNSMISARWDKIVDFDSFVDNDRESIGYTASDKTILETEIETAKDQIKNWMNQYKKNRWENQLYYPEVFIEKKALQGVFKPICTKNEVALNPCKGYPSLTFLNDAFFRFKHARDQGKRPIILYFGDYDPSGEDIPRSIEENIKKLGVEDIHLVRFALLHEQVVDWKLPPAPIKQGDSRSANWSGIGQVELDAIEPTKLQELCEYAINQYFSESSFEDLMEQQNDELIEYQQTLKLYVTNL